MDADVSREQYSWGVDLARSPLRVAAPKVGVFLLDSAVPPLDADLGIGLLLGDLDGPLHDLGLVVAFSYCSG
jgi:hypothetical protein